MAGFERVGLVLVVSIEIPLLYFLLAMTQNDNFCIIGSARGKYGFLLSQGKCDSVARPFRSTTGFLTMQSLMQMGGVFL